MYARYLVRRMLNAAVIFVIEMFVFSLLFNTTAEKTVRTQVEEQVQPEVPG